MRSTYFAMRFRIAGLVAAITAGITLGGNAATQLASRPADEWIKTLEAPDRLAGLRIDAVVASLKLRAGDTIADLGAGSGPFIVPLAKAVSPKGKVYAVDIDSGFFPYIQGKAKAAGLANVQTVLGEFTDPKLPASDVDVAFFHDVLHHIENRTAYLKSVSKYLERDARIVVIEYEAATSPHRDEPTLVVTKAQGASLLAAAGFKPVSDISLFPDKWFLVYGR
jgi:cyclopropane fatty-acyl-phospholipid synthase-like methyltransferase